MKPLCTTSFFVCIFFLNSLKGQLVVDTATSAQQLVQDFFDSTAVSVSNITYTGVNTAIGYFNGDNTNIGLHHGMLLTTGSVFLAEGPNNTGYATAENEIAGDDSMLLYHCGFATYDASILQFDFIPNDDTLFFQYVFGSEEYSEFVGSSYNDIFMFFLSGPGYADSNIAYIEGDPLSPMAVAFINCLFSPYPQYYICNDPFNTDCDGSFNCASDSSETTIQYDGFTTVLPAHAIVTPGETYHARIEIADASDYTHDSGVFLSIENFGSGYPLSNHSFSQGAIQFFPDPVSSVLNVRTQSIAKCRLSFFDLSGRMIFTRNISTNDQIDVGSLAAGAYVVEYKDAGTVYRQKIIKE